MAEPALKNVEKKGPSAVNRLGAALCHVVAATRYSLAGLGTAGRTCLAFQQEVIVFAILCLALWFFDKPVEQWLLCLGLWTLVMVVELLNTGIEYALDLITLSHCQRIKDAKDMASAAVFLVMCVNAALWVYVFFDDLWLLVQRLFA